jgi:hypothetical protein
VKTRLQRNFGGPSTLGEVEKIDSGAIWWIEVSLNARFIGFSHGLGRERQHEPVAGS